MKVKLKKIDLVTKKVSNYELHLVSFSKEVCADYIEDYRLDEQGCQYIFTFGEKVLLFYRPFKISQAQKLKGTLKLDGSHLMDRFMAQDYRVQLELYNECYMKKRKLTSHFASLVGNNTTRDDVEQVCLVVFSNELKYDVI